MCRQRAEAAPEELFREAIKLCGSGRSRSVGFVTAKNAMHVGLGAGRTVAPSGTTFLRAGAGPLAPYLPSRAYA
jgi:hypothetical protein